MSNSVVKYNFENKNVIIVGGSTGIGAAIAKLFLSNAANIFVISKSKKKLDKLYADLQKIEPKGKLTVIPIDITDLNAFRYWFDSITNEGMIFDIMVNSAGIYYNCKLMDANEEDWDRNMNINLKSVFFLSQYLAKHMALNKGGIIINIASFAAELPSVGFGVYAASKAALNKLVKSMASEWAPYNIRVIAINPGVIQTEMTKLIIERNEKVMKSQIALNRFGEPEEVAEIVLFLSTEAASYITGEIINVTGGKFITQNPHQAWKGE